MNKSVSISYSIHDCIPIVTVDEIEEVCREANERKRRQDKERLKEK
jgi:hypothetical protein